MAKPLIIFGVSKPNVYSFANIIGALENNQRIMDSYDIVVLRKSAFKRKFYITIQDDAKGLEIRDRPFIVMPYSVFTTQLKKFTKAIKTYMENLRSTNPNIITIVGGWHATGDPESILQIGADFTILGESEFIFSQLLLLIHQQYGNYRNNLNPQNQGFQDFKGALKEYIGSKIQLGELNHLATSTDDQLLIKDNITPANRPEIAVNLDDYCPYSEKFRVFSPIEISRGCPFRCKFCQTGNYWNKMRHASVDQIVKWVERAVEIKYDRVWFLSPNSFAYGAKNGVGTNPEKVRELLSKTYEIKGLDEIYFGSFPSEVRPEYITVEILDAAKPYISNDYFSIGAQTASDDLLKKINRSHEFSDVVRGVDLILDYGYGVDVDFIFGLPGETAKDRELTLEYFESILHDNKKIRIHTHTFMPLPGTPFWHEPVGKIDRETEEIVGKLATKGKAFGQYVKQSKVKKKMLKRK